MTVPREPLLRRADGRVVAGVAEGIARHLGLRPLHVRLGFAVLTLLSGSGVLMYAGLWAFVPLDSAGPGRRTLRLRTRERHQAVAIIVLAGGVLLLLGQSGLLPGGARVLPVLLAGAGVAVIWRQVDDGQHTLKGAAQGARRLLLLAGAGLVLLGLVVFVAVSGQLAATRDALASIVVIVLGLALVTAPWWWRLATDLGAERRERVRTQERAEVAAHLHDSVLQTLALIQRHVDSPREVAKLARSQERELRGWLYGALPQSSVSFGAALAAAAAEVEDLTGVVVEPVVVGDCDLDPKLHALVQATREALLNAARHARVDEVSLYAEIEPKQVAVFVRDRGIGFDLAEVPADRHGVSGSIKDRMVRHSGSACVRSEPGVGTEVELTMQREPV